jgi:hypothetical protein
MNSLRRVKAGLTPPPDPSPQLIRLSRHLQDAVLLIMRYVAHTTGREPRQEEIARVLKSYFTLEEVTNQINYLRKKPPANEDEDVRRGLRRPSLRINLRTGPPTSRLARAGLFIRPIADAIGQIRRHAQAMHGVAPGDESIALSLKSSFILSELKNQIVHARNQPNAKR